MEGYWLNLDNGKYEEVFDHANWIHNPDNQQLIGLDEGIGQQISALPDSDFKGKNRENIVMLATQGDLIRIRRYEGAISFEFQSKGVNKEKVLLAIYQFLIVVGIAGDYTQLTITNLSNNESVGILWKDFKGKVEQNDLDGILRLAQKVVRR